jgi:hypothetical protein
MSPCGLISTNLSGIATGEVFQFSHRERLGVTNHSTLGAAVGEADHRAFPRHPHCQRTHLIECHPGMIANTALRRTERGIMMYAVAGENPD